MIFRNGLRESLEEYAARFSAHAGHRVLPEAVRATWRAQGLRRLVPQLWRYSLEDVASVLGRDGGPRIAPGIAVPIEGYSPKEVIEND